LLYSGNTIMDGEKLKKIKKTLTYYVRCRNTYHSKLDLL